MKQHARVVLAMALVLAAVLMASQFSQAQATGPKILKFDTMVGIPPAFTGAQNPIRGINGGGLPWMITSGSGTLKTNGELEVEVEGLVLAAGPLAGSNPISSFRAIVSCLKSDATIDNVTTDAFPATTGPASSGGGNASIEANLTLPQPCIAPIVFVTSPGRAWFATTGH